MLLVTLGKCSKRAANHVRRHGTEKIFLIAYCLEIHTPKAAYNLYVFLNGLKISFFSFRLVILFLPLRKWCKHRLFRKDHTLL